MSDTVIVAMLGILGTLGAGVGAPFLTFLLQGRRESEERERARLQTQRERLEKLCVELLTTAGILMSAMQDIEISTWPRAVADIETRYKQDLRSAADGYASVMPQLQVLFDTDHVIDATNRLWHQSEKVTFPLYQAADTGVMPSEEIREYIRPIYVMHRDLLIAIKGLLGGLAYSEYDARGVLHSRRRRLKKIKQSISEKKDPPEDLKTLQ